MNAFDNCIFDIWWGSGAIICGFIAFKLRKIFGPNVPLRGFGRKKYLDETKGEILFGQCMWGLMGLIFIITGAVKLFKAIVYLLS